MPLTYYFTNEDTAESDPTRFFVARTASPLSLVDGESYHFVKLALNPDGTVSCAVIEPWAWPGNIKVDYVEGTTVHETSSTSLDLAGFVIEKDGKYITPAELEKGDVVFYDNESGIYFAEVYNVPITGVPSDVTETTISVNGVPYTWRKDINVIQQTKFYDPVNDIYVDVNDFDSYEKMQEFLRSYDPEAGVTVYIDRKGNIAYIDGVFSPTVVRG